MLVFEKRGKPEYRRKTSRSKDENQQQTQPTHDAESGNRTRATLVRGLRGRQMLNHCAIPAPLAMRQGECGEVRFMTQVFVLDKAKSIPIRIGSQTAWEVVRNDFIEKGSKSRLSRISASSLRHGSSLPGPISASLCI